MGSCAITAFAQPSNMSVNQEIGAGGYSNTLMSNEGGAFKARFVENTAKATGVARWQFNSDGYNNTDRKSVV